QHAQQQLSSLLAESVASPSRRFRLQNFFAPTGTHISHAPTPFYRRTSWVRKEHHEQCTVCVCFLFLPHLSLSTTTCSRCSFLSLQPATYMKRALTLTLTLTL
ncbi:unnamed protein product, partial [Ectocarpus sp. 12 AP-2014]